MQVYSVHTLYTILCKVNFKCFSPVVSVTVFSPILFFMVRYLTLKQGSNCLHMFLFNLYFIRSTYLEQKPFCIKSTNNSNMESSSGQKLFIRKTFFGRTCLL